MLVFVQMRCDPEKCLLKTSNSDAFPEVLEMHRLSGNYCTLLKVAVSSMQHLEAFNERLGKHGHLIVNIVTSSVMTNPIIDWEKPDVDVVPQTVATWMSK